jgi:probable phosphoglycerate mutase
MLAARWADIDTFGARSLMLSTASLSVLGYESSIARPVIRLWNDTHHLLAGNERYINAKSLQLTEVAK